VLLLRRAVDSPVQFAGPGLLLQRAHKTDRRKAPRGQEQLVECPLLQPSRLPLHSPLFYSRPRLHAPILLKEYAAPHVQPLPVPERQ